MRWLLWTKLVTVLAIVATTTLGCMGVNGPEAQVAVRAAPVRSGLDLINQLELATNVPIGDATVRQAIATFTGASADANAVAALRVAVQAAVGGDDARMALNASHLSMRIRVAYAFCNVAADNARMPKSPLFESVSLGTAPTQSTLSAFLIQASAKFGLEPIDMAGADRLAPAMVEAMNGRTVRESWTLACAVAAASPGADLF